MKRGAHWEKPDEYSPQDSPRMKAALAAGGVAFREGRGWRVAIRAAIAGWEGFDKPSEPDRAPGSEP